MSRIHSTAIIDPSARISESATIGPWCRVGAESVIGDDTVLDSHVVVGPYTDIGARNVVHPFAAIGLDPQDRKFRGERTRCTVGDGNVIREHATIHRGTANGGGLTAIGDHCLLMVASHVAHDCRLGDHIALANQAMLAGHVKIEDGATVSGGAGIHHYATVGTCAFIGGLTRVTKDVPPFMIVEGNPAEVRGPNRIAMERRGFSEAEIDAIRECFKRLFRESNAAMVSRVDVIRSEFADCAPVQRLCDFLDAMAAGVHGRSAELARPDDKHSMRLDPIDALPTADATVRAKDRPTVD